MKWLHRWLRRDALLAEARLEAEGGLERLRTLRAELGEELAPQEAEAERRLAALGRDLGGRGEVTSERRAKVLAGYERLSDDCRELRRELLEARPVLRFGELLARAEGGLADVPPSPERAAILIELSGLYASFGQAGPAEECLAELALDGPEEIEAAVRGLEAFGLIRKELPGAWLGAVRTRVFEAIGRDDDPRSRLDARTEAARVLAGLHGAAPPELFEGIDDPWHAEHARTAAAEALAQHLCVEEARALAEEIQAPELRARVDLALALAELGTGTLQHDEELAQPLADERQRGTVIGLGAVLRAERGELDDDALDRLEEPARSLARVERLCAEGRFDEAAAFAAGHENPEWRTGLWGEVAVAAAAADDLERARSALAEVEEPYDAARVLERMAAERSKRDDGEVARALYREAAEAYGSLVRPGSDASFAPVAIALNLAGEHARAVSAAERIEAPGVRADLFRQLGWDLGEGPGFRSVEELLPEIAGPADRAQAALGGVWGLLGRPLPESAEGLGEARGEEA